MEPDLIAFLDTHRKRIPGKLLFAKVWGSWSHNTQMPDSDDDYLLVYACEPYQMLSLSPPPETVDGEKPDFQAHEARKFASLLRKGNPSVVECLFTERWWIQDSKWADLRHQRSQFLNVKTLEQYLGYCRGQLQRMDVGTRLHTKGGTFNTKWAYHMIRIALDAERIANGEAPVVWKEGGEQKLLMDIRRGDYDPDALAEMYREIEARIESRKPWPIPEKADEQRLNTWLMQVYGLRNAC